MNNAPERVAILGLGLMGGSLGLALKRIPAGPVVAAYARRKETRQLALEREAADEVFEDPASACANAGLVVFCLPVLAIPRLAATCSGSISGNAIVTDVGSTKQHLSGSMNNIPGTFIGSHPICGSEQTGLESATSDLFVKSIVALTPLARTDPAATQLLARFWKSIGATTVEMSPEQHDATIAATSHLPHLVSAMIARLVGQSDLENVGPLSGSGFRDMTRLADGSPEIWHDIVASNSDAIVHELDRLSTLSGFVKEVILKKDFAAIRTFLEEARRARRELLG